MEFDYPDSAIALDEALASSKMVKEQQDLDMRAVLETPEGRRLLWRILSYTRPMHLSYHTGVSAEDMCFNEGRKQVGYFLVTAMTEADPTAYIELQRENL